MDEMRKKWEAWSGRMLRNAKTKWAPYPFLSLYKKKEAVRTAHLHGVFFFTYPPFSATVQSMESLCECLNMSWREGGGHSRQGRGGDTNGAIHSFGEELWSRKADAFCLSLEKWHYKVLTIALHLCWSCA